MEWILIGASSAFTVLSVTVLLLLAATGGARRPRVYRER